MSDDATVVLRLTRAEAEWLSVIIDTPSVWDHANRVLAALQAALALPAADAGTEDGLEKAIAKCEANEWWGDVGWSGGGMVPPYRATVDVNDGRDWPFFEGRGDTPLTALRAAMSRAGSQADGPAAHD